MFLVFFGRDGGGGGEKQRSKKFFGDAEKKNGAFDLNIIYLKAKLKLLEFKFQSQFAIIFFSLHFSVACGKVIL